MRRFIKSALALACLGATSSVLAQAADTSFNFSGFATLGAVQTNTDQAEFAIPGQTSGAAKKASFGVDSKLGLQLAAKFSPMFSATGQVVSKHNNDGNEKPAVEWLFGKAQLTPALAVRLGRMGLPAFAVSDFRDVNYSNLWVRPPIDVYGQVPVSNFDGADVIYQSPLWGANFSAQIFGGKAKASYGRTPVELNKLLGLNITAEFDGGISLRMGHFQSKLTFAPEGLKPLLAVLANSPFAAVGAQMDPTNKDTSFTGLGLTVDRDSWVASMEFTMRRSDSAVPDTNGWYASGGYRIGKFTPYVVVSELRTVDSNVNNTIPRGLSPQITVLAATVDGALNAYASAQETQAVGVRWDAYRNTAIKLQFEQIKVKASSGPFQNAKPGFGIGSKVNVMSLSADIVF
jgi:hypothetical protein